MSVLGRWAAEGQSCRCKDCLLGPEPILLPLLASKPILLTLVGLYDTTTIRFVEGTRRDHGGPLECWETWETKEAYFRWADLAQRI